MRAGPALYHAAEHRGRSGYKVVTEFDKPLNGFDGEKCICDLQLFRGLEFIPSGKQFRQLVDPVTPWSEQRKPYRITIHVTYRESSRWSFRMKALTGRIKGEGFREQF